MDLQDIAPSICGRFIDKNFGDIIMLTSLYVKSQLALDGANKRVKQFIGDERGVTAIEYAILGVAVAAIVLAVFGAADSPLRQALDGAITQITTSIDGAGVGTGE